MAEARASLILEVIRNDYQSVVEAAGKATLDLVAAQGQVIAQAPKARAARAAEVDATKEQAKALNEVEKAYISALAPHEKTALKLEQIADLRFDDIEATSKQAVAMAHLSSKLEDQTRRFEQNRGSQNKLSRSLAELLDEQTKAQTAAIAAGAALIKQGASADKLSSAVVHLRKQEGDHREELARLEKQLEQVTAAEKAHGAASEAAAKHYKASADKLDSIKNALEGLGIPGAQTVDSIKKLNESLVKMHDEGNAAQASMLKGAIAVGAVGAAAAAAVVGVAALGAALIANSATADEHNEELRELGLSLDAVGTASVNRAAAGIDAVGASAKAVGVNIANTLAPAMEAGSTRLVALGLAATDAWKEFSAGKKTLDIIADSISIGMVGAFNALVSPIKNTAIGLALLSDSIGITDDAAANVNKTFAEWTESLEESTAAGLKVMIRDGLEPLIAASDDYMGKAAEVVTRQESVNRAARDGAEAQRELADAYYTVSEASVDAGIAQAAASSTAVDAFVASYDLRIDVMEGYEDDVLASINRVTKADLAAIRERKREEAARISTGVSMAGQAANAAVNLARMVAGESSAAFKIAFIAQQAAALGQVTVDTFAAISRVNAVYAGNPVAQAAFTGVAIATGVLAAGGIAAATVGQFNTPSVSFGVAGAGGGGGGGGSSSANNFTSQASTGQGGGGMAGQGGSDTPSDQSSSPTRKGDSSNLPVTDAYFPPTMGRRTIEITPGDEAQVNRASPMGRSANADPAMRRAVEAQTAEARETNGLLRQVRDLLMVQQLQTAVAGPAGRR